MTRGQPWSREEHARFIQGLELFPSGPWKEVASIVGSRDARQTMSHAQKYRMRIKRHKQKQEKQEREDQQRLQLQQQNALVIPAGASIEERTGERLTTAVAANSMTGFDTHLIHVSTAMSTTAGTSFALPNVALPNIAVPSVVEQSFVVSKFDQRTSALMSPLPFDSSSVGEMPAALHDILYSDGASSASISGHSFEGYRV